MGLRLIQKRSAPRVCSFFAKGTCKFGNACKLYHGDKGTASDVSAAAPPVPGETTAFAFLTEEGNTKPTMKCDPKLVQELLDRDWELFVQMRDTVSGTSGATVIGRDVHDAVRASNVAVLF